MTRPAMPATTSTRPRTTSGLIPRKRRTASKVPTEALMARAKAKKNEPNLGGMAFGRNLMVLGGLILALGLYGAARGTLTLGWPRVEATITTADLARQTVKGHDSDGNSRDESWNSFHVLYTYT